MKFANEILAEIEAAFHGHNRALAALAVAEFAKASIGATHVGAAEAAEVVERRNANSTADKRRRRQARETKSASYLLAEVGATGPREAALPGVPVDLSEVIATIDAYQLWKQRAGHVLTPEDMAEIEAMPEDIKTKFAARMDSAARFFERGGFSARARG